MLFVTASAASAQAAQPGVPEGSYLGCASETASMPLPTDTGLLSGLLNAGDASGKPEIAIFQQVSKVSTDNIIGIQDAANQCKGTLVVCEERQSHDSVVGVGLPCVRYDILS